MSEDPIKKFSKWQQRAKDHQGIIEPTAASLATVDAKGQPSARMVLVKQADARGFVFYTNMEGRKSRDIKGDPKVALCFHWMPLRLQVRVEGVAEPVSDAEADAYFASRPRMSQLGAWSKQSEVLDSRDTLLKMVEEKAKMYGEGPIPRPKHWSGWRVAPEKIEFWEEGENRLHQRELFTRKGQGWESVKLYP